MGFSPARIATLRRAAGLVVHPSSAAMSKESGPTDHDGEDTVTEVDYLFDIIDQYMKSPHW